MLDAAAPATVAFINQLPFEVVIYDSYGSDTATSYVGDLTQLATVAAGASASVPPAHPFASVFIVAHKDSDAPIARFVWLKARPAAGFTVSQADVDAMNQTFAFIDFLTHSPGDPLARRFLALIGDQTSSTLTDDVNAFFAGQPSYAHATFVTYMLGITATARTVPAGPPTPGAPPPPPQYSLSRLVGLMGGTWPGGLPDIIVARYRAEDQDGTLMFWAEIDVKRLPGQGPGPVSYVADLVGADKVVFGIMFHYGLDAGIFSTRLILKFDDLAIPLDKKTRLRIKQPTLTIDINPLFKFVVFGIKGTIPFAIFGKSFDALATLTIDNLEVAAGLVIQGDHASLPGPPQLPGLHFDEFGVGMAIFFEPPGYAIGLAGKFHIGNDAVQHIALDDDSFALVLRIEEELPNPLYASFYVPRLDLPTLLALFTNTRTPIDVPVAFSDLSFVWAENPLEPVVLPDGTLSQAALGFSATVEVLSFGFHGEARLDLSGGLTADVESSPVSLGRVFQLAGDGKGVSIKVDAQGNPIKNNAIRDKAEQQAVVKEAKDKQIVSPGGPVLKIQSLQAPFLHLNARASLFELAHVAVEADIDKSGIRFELDYGSVLTTKMKVALADFHNLSAEFGFGIDRTIALPHVGPVSLGSLHLQAGIAAHLKVLTSTQDVSLTAGGGFEFQGLHLTVPDFTVDAHIARLTDLLSAIGSEIEAEARSVFGAVLGDARRWAAWVGGKVITGVEDMAPVLKAAFNQSLTDAVAVMKGAAVAAEVVAAGARTAYQAASADVARAMKAAGYAASDVGRGVQKAYQLSEVGLAQTLKAAGYGAEAIGGALRSAFNDSAAAAAVALKGAGYAANEVAGALKGTFTSSAQDAASALHAAGFAPDQIAGAAKTVFGASTQVAAQILQGLGVAGDAANTILHNIGYPASEISNVLKDLFHWVPYINLPYVKMPYVKLPHIKIF